MKLDRGAIVLVDLDPTRGHEQRGQRPRVVCRVEEGVALFLGLGERLQPLAPQ